MNGWDWFDFLRSELSDSIIAEAMARALCDDTLRDICEYIARCYDIDIDD